MLAADPYTGNQAMVTGAELATDKDLLLWMPLPPPDSFDSYLHKNQAS